MLMSASGPFDFNLSLATWKMCRSRGPDYVILNKYRRVTDCMGDVYLIEAESLGTEDKPLLRASSLEPRCAVLSVCALTQMKWILGLDMDLVGFYRLLDLEEETSDLKRQLYGLRPPRLPSPFEALVSGIIEQQISAAAASTIRARLVKRCGRRVDYEDREYYGFPSTEKLASLGFSELRGVGLPPRKARAIQTVAGLVSAGAVNLEAENGALGPEVVDRLLDVQGIGPWTIEYALWKGWGDCHAIPVKDIALHRGLQMYYGSDRVQSPKGIERLLSRFGEYSGYAA